MDGKDPPGISYDPNDNTFNLDLVHGVLPPGVDWKDLKAVQSNLLDVKPPAYI